MFETIGIACVLLLLVAIVFIGVDLFTPRAVVKPRTRKDTIAQAVAKDWKKVEDSWKS